MKDFNRLWIAIALLALSVPCLSAPTLKLMRITCEYKTSDTNYGSGNALTGKYLFSKKLMETTRTYFQRALKVTSEENMSIAETPVQGETFVVPAVDNKPMDLYVYINAINKPETSAFATAFYVTTDPTTNRPISGVYDLNLAHVVDTVPNSMVYFSTFAHEFFHILGFHDGLYAAFKKNNVLIPANEVSVTGNYFGGTNRMVIVLPEVRDFARTYFNEPGLMGVPIEDGGGSGSAGAHWEKGFLPNEFMNPSVELPGILSEFSFKLLEGTGWYTIEYDWVQKYTWGKGVTGHLSGVCPTTAGQYCTTLGEAGCSHDFMSKADCHEETTFSTCKYWRNTGKYCTINATEMMPDAKEKYGANSRCVMWGNVPRCNEVECISNVVTVKVMINGTLTNFACSADGAVINAGGESFTCPASQVAFCNLMSAAERCPNDCNGRGICMGVNSVRNCQCKYGWSGTECQTQEPDLIGSGPPPVTEEKKGVPLISTISILVGLAISLFVL